MGTSLTVMMARLPEARRRRVEARTENLIAEEMTLRDLRKAMGKTQAAVAEKLGLKQENVSRVEARADMLLSTLDGYLRAMGGRLRLTVEFTDRAPVLLSGLTSHIAPTKTARAKPAAKTAPPPQMQRRTGPAPSRSNQTTARRGAASATGSASKTQGKSSG